MDAFEALKLRLRSVGLKATPQRLLILTCIASAGRPLTADEIFRLCTPGETNLSTVYRTLAALGKGGVLSRTLRLDGAAEYYIAGTHHSHQAVCVCCGRTAELPECPLESLERSMERQTGFLITGHSLELTGICPECRRKGMGKA